MVWTHLWVSPLVFKLTLIFQQVDILFLAQGTLFLSEFTWAFGKRWGVCQHPSKLLVKRWANTRLSQELIFTLALGHVWIRAVVGNSASRIYNRLLGKVLQTLTHNDRAQRTSRTFCHVDFHHPWDQLISSWKKNHVNIPSFSIFCCLTSSSFNRSPLSNPIFWRWPARALNHTL